MYHSISFFHITTSVSKNTWNDWKLIPTQRPVFQPPAFKEQYIEIPGADGALDISTLLSNRPTFQNRVGSFQFLLSEEGEPWDVVYAKVSNFLHGQRVRAILEDDPGFFYEGRFTLHRWSSNRNFATLDLSYNVGPYKKKLNGTLDDWLWDPFNFETDYVPEDYSNVLVNGTDSLVLMVQGSPQPVIPTFITTGTISVKYKGTIYDLPTGKSKVADIIVREGTHTFTFSGNGRVTLDYRGGSL